MSVGVGAEVPVGVTAVIVGDRVWVNGTDVRVGAGVVLAVGETDGTVPQPVIRIKRIISETKALYWIDMALNLSFNLYR
jgi:hypothetical protein